MRMRRTARGFAWLPCHKKRVAPSGAFVLPFECTLALMPDAKEFTETLRRLLHVPRKDLDAEERKWQEEQREKRERGSGENGKV